MAASSVVPGGTNRFASPMRRASSPDTPRPVRMRSSAWLCPSKRASRMVPPSIRGMPQRRRRRAVDGVRDFGTVDRDHGDGTLAPELDAHDVPSCAREEPCARSGAAVKPLVFRHPGALILMDATRWRNGGSDGAYGL